MVGGIDSYVTALILSLCCQVKVTKQLLSNVGISIRHVIKTAINVVCTCPRLSYLIT